SHDSNRAPAVYAGPPQYLSGRMSTVLGGSLDDDMLPLGSPLEFHWETISGPATPSIDSNRPNATVSFGEPGTYVLRYSASDGAATTSDEVTIVVGQGAETFRGFVQKDSVI